MSKTFVLTLLGTCTNYAEKFGVPYVRGETLSVIHDSVVGQAISSDPNNPIIAASAAAVDSGVAASASASAGASGPDGSDVTKAIIDGPDGGGFSVYQKIAQATILMFQQIAEGASTIQINAHSRGAVEGIFVAHEFDRIRKIIKNNPAKNVDEIYELITDIDRRWSFIKMLWTHDCDTDNGVREVYRTKYTGVLKALIKTFKDDIQKLPLPAADSTAVLDGCTSRELPTCQSKLDAAKLKIFALDPVPGGTAIIRWEHSKFYYLPKDVDCDVYYMADERSGGFRAVILRDGVNIRKHLLPGNHASASGNFWRQSHSSRDAQVVYLGKKDGKEICSVTDDRTMIERREVVLHHIQDLTLIKLVESLRKSGVSVDADQLGPDTAACKKTDGKYDSIHQILIRVTRQDLTPEERLAIYEQLQQDSPAYGLLCDGSRDAVYTYYQSSPGSREVRVRAALSDLTYQVGNLGILFSVPQGYVNFEHLEVKLEVLRKQLMIGIAMDEPAQSVSAVNPDENIVLDKINAIKTLIDRVVRVKLDVDDTRAFEGCKQWLGVYVDYTMATILKNGLSDTTLESIFDTFKYVLKVVSPEVTPPTASQSAPVSLKHQIKEFLQEKAYSLFESRLSEVELRINEFDKLRIRSTSDDTAGAVSAAGDACVGSAVSELTALDKFVRLQFLVEQYYELCKRTTKFERYRQQLAAEDLELISSVSSTEYIKRFSKIKKDLLEDIRILSQTDAGKINVEYYSGSVACITEDIISKEIKIAVGSAEREKEKIGRSSALSDDEIRNIKDGVKTSSAGIAEEITKNIDSLFKKIGKISLIEEISVPRLVGEPLGFEPLDEPFISPVNDVIGPPSTVFALWCQSFSRVAAEESAQTKSAQVEVLEGKLAEKQGEFKLSQSEIARLAARILSGEKRATEEKQTLNQQHAKEKVGLCQARDAAEKRVGVLQVELDAAKAAALAATGVAEAATAAAAEQIGVAQAATVKAQERVEALRVERDAAANRERAAKNDLERYKKILKFASMPVAILTAGAGSLFSLVPIEASVLTSFLSPAAAWEPISQAVSFGAQPVGTTYSPVTDLKFCPVELVIDILAKYPASANTTTTVLGALATTPAAVAGTCAAVAGTCAAEALTCAAPVIATVANTSLGALVTAPATVAATCAAQALTCAAPAVADTAVASLETLMTSPATYVAQALTYVTSTVVNTVASTSGALVVAPASGMAATCAAQALTCAAPVIVANPSIGALVATPAASVAATCAAEALTYAAPVIVANPSIGALVTAPASFAATCAPEALTYAVPVVANTTATVIEALTTMPAAIATNASAGVCLAAEAAGVYAAELTASGAIFTSLVTPVVAVATGFCGLAALGAAAYYGYKYYTKSENDKTVEAGKVAPESEVKASAPVKLVPEVTTAAPIAIIEPKKAVNAVKIVPAIASVTTLPIQQTGNATAGKGSHNSKKPKDCQVDAVAKNEPIIPPAKIISITSWKLGIYTGFAVTAVVGSTLAVYFVAPLIAPVIMAYVATAQAAVTNFVLQHAFLIPVINALTSIANYSSQLAVPAINLLTSFTHLLVNLVTANSVSNTVIGVKSLMLTVGSGLAVGTGTIAVAEASSKVIDKLRK